MKPVERRLVLHFPGFEPLDAEAHHARYARAAAQSGPLFDLSIAVGGLEAGGAAPAFEVTGRSGAAGTASRIHVFDYSGLIARLAGRPTALRLATGFLSAARVVLAGGLLAYLRHGWRFALFFLFPFVSTLLALAISLAIAALPLLAGWPPAALLASTALGAVVFVRGFLPFSERWHVLHLFGDWDLALELARPRDPALLAWLDDATRAARAALAGEADEVLVTSHSMGSGIAVLVLGAVLEADPDALRGRRLLFLTLGGAVLQTALLRPAALMRARVGRIAATPSIRWIEVQCLNDVVHFYRSNVVAACGHAAARQAKIVFIRIKQMLDRDRYRRIRRDALRVHRQYVLGSDRRSAFDFAVLTAGPMPAAEFLDPNPAPEPAPDTRRALSPREPDRLRAR